MLGVTGQNSLVVWHFEEERNTDEIQSNEKLIFSFDIPLSGNCYHYRKEKLGIGLIISIYRLESCGIF